MEGSQGVQRRRLNISAALAIAIERQVEDIIAIAKAHSLQYRAPRGGFPNPSMSGPNFAPHTQFHDPEADQGWTASDALRLWSDFPRSYDAFAEPTHLSESNIWIRLRSLLSLDRRATDRGRRD
jgi:hypothetical protein